MTFKKIIFSTVLILCLLLVGLVILKKTEKSPEEIAAEKKLKEQVITERAERQKKPALSRACREAKKEDAIQEGIEVSFSEWSEPKRIRGMTWSCLEFSDTNVQDDRVYIRTALSEGDLKNNKAHLYRLNQGQQPFNQLYMRIWFQVKLPEDSKLEGKIPYIVLKKRKMR